MDSTSHLLTVIVAAGKRKENQRKKEKNGSKTCFEKKKQKRATSEVNHLHGPTWASETFFKTIDIERMPGHSLYNHAPTVYR